MGGKIKKWISEELEKGEDPELLKMSLKAQNLDPGMVDEVQSKREYSFAYKIPWKPILAVVIIIALAFFAYNWMSSQSTQPPLDSRFNLTLVEGNPEAVALNVGFIDGINKSLRQYGSYDLRTELQENHCYSVYNDWDLEGNYLGVKEVYSPTMNCLGDKVADTRLEAPHFVSIEFDERGASCICEETGVNIETSETRNMDTGKATINLKIKKK
ncbi:MAG: hypothetical protein L6243_00950 [Candidatus Altiarchaeales archaeon]|nr:hypothetical protein [Candidatus Altiarchaeota archaeon]MCG2782138.1 hypothetical protein [Candidatus Altiarchaeales archaeon]MBU4266707.1 hypothetical protein [Candidatus Altiarchaeota archaeon]MBU4342009.1 hypothetical protein [Candidatus Altiarchaeota archaeon]MBU4406781.1 hypothetical protein [Candidatus Altiarchaeota archaeon]